MISCNKTQYMLRSSLPVLHALHVTVYYSLKDTTASHTQARSFLRNKLPIRTGSNYQIQHRFNCVRWCSIRSCGFHGVLIAPHPHRIYHHWLCPRGIPCSHVIVESIHCVWTCIYPRLAMPVGEVASGSPNGKIDDEVEVTVERSAVGFTAPWVHPRWIGPTTKLPKALRDRHRKNNITLIVKVSPNVGLIPDEPIGVEICRKINPRRHLLVRLVPCIFTPRRSPMQG